MNTGKLFFLLFLLLSVHSVAQKASYSHQTIHVGYTDQVQLIANIASRHHLLVVKPKKAPSLYIFDQALKLLDHKEIPTSIPENCDIQILTFANHYFIFTHIPKTDHYQFWKVDGNGSIQNMLPVFHDLALSFFRDRKATVQVYTNEHNIYLRTQVYYPETGKLQISLITTNPLLQVLSTDRISTPFHQETENLQQVLIVDKERFYVLKRTRKDESENLLEVMKCNLKSGEILTTQFNIHYNLFSLPAMNYDAIDSSLIVYSMVREPVISSIVKRSVFLCRLDDSLHTLGSAVMFNTSNLFNFFLVSGTHFNWMHFFNAGLRYNMPQRAMYSSPNDYYSNEWSSRYYSLSDQIYLNEPKVTYANRFKLSILNPQLKVVSDSVIMIENKDFVIRYENFGRFKWQNKSCLVMEQQLPGKSTGLLLITNEEGKRLNITDIPVYNRYHYLLKQLQQTKDENIIVPYINKEQVGLMKLDLKDESIM